MTKTTEVPTTPPSQDDGNVAERARAIYDLGAGTVYALRSDPRFSYCTYVPRHIGKSGTRHMQLVVAMHGTGRGFVNYRYVRQSRPRST